MSVGNLSGGASSTAIASSAVAATAARASAGMLKNMKNAIVQTPRLQIGKFYYQRLRADNTELKNSAKNLRASPRRIDFVAAEGRLWQSFASRPGQIPVVTF